VTEAELTAFLRSHFPQENERCEWKEFKNLKNCWNSRKGEDVETYVSAIANMRGGHLVLGVEDQTLKVVGIHEFGDYTVENGRYRLAGRCAHLNSEKLRIQEFVTDDTGLKVWVLHIPQHEPRTPVNAHGHPWQRVGDSLVAMRPERLHAILSEPLIGADWTAQVVEGATIATDLDVAAINVAREKFKEKNTNQSWKDEVDSWEDSKFLDKIKLTAHGKITRAALLLLGKSECVHWLSPHPAQITWKLETEDQTYEHFGPPFILTTTEVLNRIRNVPQRLFPNSQLLAIEIQKYDTSTILEALHNCIAHQDYERAERILIVERPDRLIFENAGSFIEGEPEDYFKGAKTPRLYRNRWLADAMVEVKMIDTMGFGISRMTAAQRNRFLPLPDYHLTAPTAVILEVLGRPIDERYTQLLLDRRDLDIDTVILLDRVQKKLPITDEAISQLRRAGLIEGRKPNIFVASAIAEATGTQADYTQTRGVSDERLVSTLLEHLQRFRGGTSRPAIDQLLMPMVSKSLNSKQKKNKITNLLAAMKRAEQIRSEGRGPGAKWFVAE